MADLSQGPLLTVRRAGLQVTRHANGQLPATDVDVMCVNRSGGTLAGAVAGSDAVTIKWDEFVAGDFLPIKALELTTEGLFGVVHWDAGTVADDGRCWVRVRGVHPYAKVEGSTAVAAGDPLGWLSGQAAGEVRKVATFGSAGAMALAAQAAASVVATSVYLLNRFGIPG